MGAGSALDDSSIEGMPSTASPAGAVPPSALGAPAPAADDSQNGNAQPQMGTPNKPQLPGYPGTVQFDKKKLAQVNNAADLLDAMKPKSRNDYMDWWQKTHGDIDKKYDAMQESLGQRPTDQGLSRQEKFGALVQFGLHLLASSGAQQNRNNQAGLAPAAAGDTLDSVQKQHDANLAKTQDQFDTSSSNIEKAREADQKDLGTYGAAMKTQSGLDRDATAEEKARFGMLKDAGAFGSDKADSEAGFGQDASGNTVAFRRGPDGHMVAEPVSGIDGKPFKGRVLGKEAGSGVPRPTDTAQIRNQRYLTNVLGMDENTSTQIAFHAKSGDPQKDHASIYRAALSANAGDDVLAQRAADQYVLENYGAGAIAKARQPAVRPPDNLTQSWKPGFKYPMKDPSGRVSYWKKNSDGTIDQAQ